MSSDSMYSQPWLRGGSSSEKLSVLPSPAAVALNDASDRMNVCVISVPSVVASVFTSRRSCRPDVQNRIFATLSAASFVAKSSATFVWRDRRLLILPAHRALSGARQAHGLASAARDGLLRHRCGRRKSPCSVNERANADPIRLGVGDAGDLMLARVQRLTAIVADARVGVLSAGSFRGVQCFECEIVGEDLSRCREETARL